jgi:hypothetical protein
MPAHPHPSRAEEGEHARKLYSLFARDHLAYAMPSTAADTKRTNAAGGQVVVKESYRPELVTSPTVPLDFRSHFQPYAQGADGKLYRASAIVGVYVIFEKPKGTPGTDDGFVYGTLTPTGDVTSAGRVASCMGCHAKAKHGRLFGTTVDF